MKKVITILSFAFFFLLFSSNNVSADITHVDTDGNGIPDTAVCTNGAEIPLGEPGPPPDVPYSPDCSDGCVPPSNPTPSVTPSTTPKITPSLTPSPTPSPTATPTPTPIPAVCNEDCANKSCAAGLTCKDIGDNKKACRLPSNPDSTTCAVPTPTPTLTPTPTPVPFSEAMCKCDGLQVSPQQFVAGGNVHVTAFGKVEGGDTSFAKITSFKFQSGSGPNNTSIHTDNVNPVTVSASIVENNPAKVRYKSEWDYKVPAKLDPNKIYKIWAKVTCVKKSAYAPVQSVAGASTGQSFFGSIASFFTNLFGGGSHSTQSIQSIPNTSSQQVASNDQLQLGSFNETTELTETDNCSYVNFRVKKFKK